jgi:hypothetical protein
MVKIAKIFSNILTAAATAMILKCILDDCNSYNDSVLEMYSINTGIT